MKGDDYMKCLNCGKELTNRQVKYCSNKCQREYQEKEKIQAWKNGTFDGMSGQYGISSTIRNYLFKKYDNKCQKCGWGEVNPTTNLIPLEIHHIDGDYRNNKEENLELLCPNCHSLTPNFKALNKTGREDRNQYKNRKYYCLDCGKEISYGALRCNECNAKLRITKKPVTKEELKKLIRTVSFTEIGRMYNVTDNTIRKWCIGYNLPSKRKILFNILMNNGNYYNILICYCSLIRKAYPW